MKIKYKNYTLEPCSTAQGRYDLSRKISRRKMNAGDTPNEPTGETYEADDTIGYGMRMETCIKNMIELEIKENNSELELVDYLKMYRKLAKEIKDYLKLD